MPTSAPATTAEPTVTTAQAAPAADAGNPFEGVIVEYPEDAAPAPADDGSPPAEAPPPGDEAVVETSGEEPPVEPETGYQKRMRERRERQKEALEDQFSRERALLTQQNQLLQQQLEELRQGRTQRPRAADPHEAFEQLAQEHGVSAAEFYQQLMERQAGNPGRAEQARLDRIEAQLKADREERGQERQRAQQHYAIQQKQQRVISNVQEAMTMLEQEAPPWLEHVNPQAVASKVADLWHHIEFNEKPGRFDMDDVLDGVHQHFSPPPRAQAPANAVAPRGNGHRSPAPNGSRRASPARAAESPGSPRGTNDRAEQLRQAREEFHASTQRRVDD